MNILIIKPSSLGDVVQALPVLKCLREKYPQASIDWLVNEGLGDILVGNPYVRTIHLWDRGSWRKPRRLFAAIKNTATVVHRVRQARYDMVLDLQGLLRSGLIAFLSGAKKVTGFSDAREMAPIFYGKKVEAPVHRMHSVERYVLAAGRDASEEMEFPIALSSGDRQSTEKLLARMEYDRDRPMAILAPGARWPTKRWPQENFAVLSRMLVRNQGAQVGFVGSGSEKDAIQRIASLSECCTMDLSGKTGLKQLACLLKEADVVVGNDSGPIHVAAAVGTPVVGLYGPTSPARTGPYGRQHTVLISRLPCSPCFSRKCSMSMACMRDISVEAVYEACKPYLNEPESKRERESL